MLAAFYYYSGGFALHLWWLRRRQRDVLILTFHRVLPEASPVLQNHLALRSIIVTLENFHQLLAFLKKRFAFIGLESLAHASNKPARPACVLTFDDGYQDFFQHAWPALQREGASATMFLPTALIGTTHKFWWDELYRLGMQLENYTANGHSEEVSLLVQRIASTAPEQRGPLVYDLIDRLQDRPPENVQALLAGLKVRPGVERVTEHDNRLMTWEEIAALHNEGVSFGSHTRRHLNLATLSPEQLHEEIVFSKHDLELKLHTVITSIAFPGGHFSEETLRVVRRAGYALACSTRRGFTRPGAEELCLRRCNVWDGMLQDFRGRFSKAVFAFNLMRADF